MLKGIKALLKAKIGPSENEDFIRLMQLMKEDQLIRDYIKSLVVLDETMRTEVIHQKIQELESRGAAKSHIEIFQYLMDQEICDRIKAKLL